MTKVLIVDRSKSMRNTLRERLEYEGYATECAATSAAADELCSRSTIDIILTDDAHNVPRIGVPFIVLASESSVDAAVDAVRAGATEFLTRPIDMNRLLGAIRKVSASSAAEPIEEQPAVAVSAKVRRRVVRVEEIVGVSEAISHVRELIDKVAPSDARVLITGANGTGKELVARWLHEKSRRAAAPFVEVNCAAIPSELIESELFGHEKGAFTSAVKQRKGKFEQAAGGTLFMDEIGDMSGEQESARGDSTWQRSRGPLPPTGRDCDLGARAGRSPWRYSAAGRTLYRQDLWRVFYRTEEYCPDRCRIAVGNAVER